MRCNIERALPRREGKKLSEEISQESDIIESKKLVETGVLVKKLATLNDVCLSQAKRLDKLEKMVFSLYSGNNGEQ